MRGEIESRLASGRYGARVTLLGRVDDMPRLISRSHILVVPSLMEATPYVILEAMAAGRPVVAFRAGGALDTIREGLNGVFFDDQHPEALVAALADPRLDHGWDRSEMIAHAETFGRERYRAGMIRELATAWADHGGARR